MNESQQATCRLLTAFLRQRWDLIPQGVDSEYGLAAPLSTAEELAVALLRDPEWRSLQLGTWLGTAASEVVDHAVAQVIPPMHRSEFDLVTQAITIAALTQCQQGQKTAGFIAVVVLAVAGAALYLTAKWRRRH